MFFLYILEPENKTQFVSTSHLQRNKVTVQPPNAQATSTSNLVTSLPPTNERNANIDLISPLPSDCLNNPSKVSKSERPQTKDKSMKRKSVLNTYSSEELLLQAASSLQGLEGINITK